MKEESLETPLNHTKPVERQAKLTTIRKLNFLDKQPSLRTIRDGSSQNIGTDGSFEFPESRPDLYALPKKRRIANRLTDLLLENPQLKVDKSLPKSAFTNGIGAGKKKSKTKNLSREVGFYS